MKHKTVVKVVFYHSYYNRHTDTFRIYNADWSYERLHALICKRWRYKVRCVRIHSVKVTKTWVPQNCLTCKHYTWPDCTKRKLRKTDNAYLRKYKNCYEMREELK